MAYKIAVDAGHGLNTAGKRCDARFDAAQTREWTLNSRIVEQIVALLGEYDVQITRTDDPSGATDIGLSARAKKANAAGADIFISVHHNAGGGRGVEVHAYSGAVNAKTLELQRTIYDELVAANGNRGTRARPCPRSNFAVLRETAMPAVLIENGFMDHPTDTPLILSEGYAKSSAIGIVNGIVKFAGLSKTIAPAPEKDGPAESGTYTVKRGDTLSGIAKAHGVALVNLIKANSHVANVNLIYPGMKLYIPGVANEQAANYLTNAEYRGTSIVSALAAIGVDSSFAYRRKLAAANSITAYVGTASQNTKLLALLKAGRLIKA